MSSLSRGPGPALTRDSDAFPSPPCVTLYARSTEKVTASYRKDWDLTPNVLLEE